MSESYCFLNGKIIPEKDASLPLSDIGILRAFSVYDGIASFEGKPFLFQNHYERFVRSATALGIAIPYSNEELYEALCEMLQKSHLTERANIRAVATGGTTIAGIEFKPENSTIFFTAVNFVPLPKEFYETGAKLITHEYKREFPEYKTVNYITGVLLQKRRKEAGAVEILYVKDGHVYECATSNIFIVKNGELVTPHKDVLPGITKKLVCVLAMKEGIVCREGDVSVDDLFAAEEVFITSSFKDIVPIVEIDGKMIKDGKKGLKTRQIMSLVQNYLDSRQGLDLQTRV
ncbi:MAG: hypothetical protein COV34_01435 [Candidatus Zambryskibacteria bacterium CG10_big_fil_rev_8_21_14_0_10_42_12]|uniref:Amino acid aminotransferase n=1 Tax=Candidatus Zambryskibacteria bacterium CG10_big_fil_rev_8_21_14_0_10_42_12 TaxID=1975115 RepID=A0A2H0QXA6_9BACT|nr:MAG: hypothetical protein COV34_01435 [Candidatus Zambryskibacteria bacterium CG10_big_fil_rev_8_21_14_0_10_42_12]